MAETLAVVSAVASIAQLVDFGSKVLLRLSEFQSSVGEVPKTFQHVKAELPVLLDTLERTKIAIETDSIRDETKKALLPAIEGYRTQIESLDIAIGKVLPLPDDSWSERSRKAISSLRQDGKVKKIRTDLQGYIQTLTYYHAAASSTLRSRIETLSLRPTPSSTVPFRRDRDFVDCDILSEIRQRCSQPASRVALVGLGGVGKSQVAIEYSYQLRKRSPETWVFWVHASSAARFKKGYRKVAQRLKIPGWEKPESDILSLVSNWLCDETNGRWVMIVDNADDPSVFFPQESRDASGDASSSSGPLAEPLSVFLPQSPNGSILVTSRNQELVHRLMESASDIIKVEPMDQGHALALFQRKLRVGTSFDAHDAVELVKMLDYMPLAITQAAAYVSQRAARTTVSKYLHDLGRSDKERASLLKKDVGDSRRDGSASNSIIATWQISFEHIRANKPSAARLLSLMSLFDWQRIPESLLDHHYQEGDMKDGFEDDIYTLCSYSLIRTNVDGNGFDMHRLVQFSTKTWLELNRELEIWKEKYVTIINEAFPVGRYENWSTCQNLFPHAELILEYQPTNKVYLEHWSSILFNAAWYADDKGSYSEAEEMSRRAQEGYRKALGQEHPSTLTSMANLASTYRNQGRWREAEELFVQAMETRKRVQGPEHPDTLTSMANLASTYRNQGRWEEAEELFVQVMETSLRVLEPEHPDTLTCIANLALTYWNQGRWKEAEGLFVQVIEASLRALGPEHPDTLSSMANLASTYWNQGRRKEAEGLIVQVIEACLRVLGPEHPDTLFSMANLASTYRNQGRWKEAEELEVQVIEASLRAQGPEHPDTLTSMSNLASTYRNQGRWKEAEELGVRVMETRQRVLGPEHPDTLTSINNLAVTLKSQSNSNEAISLMQKCFRLQKQVLGPQHPYTKISLEALNEWADGEI
ncbi:TPR-like protein [Lepidopterella palustris CBS 459.81]|uniref:TPR-like protein n=1 Tax=Lepidopterella palustris CBS 459.81 TaxID=1314670 RepID=A0A8E2JGT8_9PEZI|nr:TPR-like protein [Lepidopterella palustris CBS 459.81]